MALTLFTESGGGPPGTQAPYYAPTYFPPAYFYGGAGDSPAPTDPTLGQTPYNTPTYFPPSFFYGGLTSSSPPPSVPKRLPGRDGGCYAALVALLEAIGVFNSVVFGDPSQRSRPGADADPVAIVTPQGWEEADDTDPALDVRRVTFTIRVVIRVGDDASPFDRLDSLAAAVQAQVDRSSLNGQCLPALTKIRAGHYQSSSQYPEWSVDLDGEFALLIDPSADPVVI